MKRVILLLVMALVLCWAGSAGAVVCNVKVVSDSRPDFTDTPSLIASATGRYQTTEEKCKAMWRWLTRCRRQTPEGFLHGAPVHDPIMFYNDFGYSFCSDYASINCGIWHEMGLPVKLWDITAHTVSECYYDGRWHMFDNSMSAYYTLCDGKTVAGVEDVGKENACAASGSKTEMAHAALYHCAAATSANGFLSGCDTQRSLKEEGEYVFNPNRLKYRYYYNGFELGHRYTLNLRENETYTRYTKPLGTTKDYYLPLPDGGSPQDLGTFGNGEWVWKLDLAKPGPADAQYLVNAANIVTSAEVILTYEIPRKGGRIEVSSRPDWERPYSSTMLAKTTSGPKTEEIPLPKVAGSHQYLLSLHVSGGAVVSDAELHTFTQLNKLTLPALTLGKNTIDVTAGDPLDTIAVWPELQKDAFERDCAANENVTSGEACDWHGCLWLEKPGTGHLTYAVVTPTPMIELTYGGRFYNRAPGSSIAMEYSTDEGKTWLGKWTLTSVDPPWDTVHCETAKLPPGTKRALVRYTLNSTSAGSYEGCSLYSVRMMATYRPAGARFQPLEVTYNWSERQGDKWVERSHTQLITNPKQRYYIAVGGEDHPRLNWIRTNLASAMRDVKYGYADGVEGSAQPLKRVTHVWGKDLALGKHHTFSVPSGDNWDGGDPGMTKLTDEVVASTYAGGTTYRWGPIWAPNQNPAITLDLEKPQTIAAARIHVTGYPFDLYNGPFCTVEILTSEDGVTYQSQGSFQTKMRAVDLDGDFLNQERGGFESLVFPLVFKQPVQARYIQYKITNPEMYFDTSEIMAYDSVRVLPWSEPLAMPLDR